ncbi:MAG: HIT family protein [Candidatus Gracilibacteria bacterium]|nr:HIT family protein [Candidatus Gracilibacteria bacterium]
MSTLFSKIIAGEIPSFKIYEDEFVYAFLDIFPQTPGHTLIVPKIEIDHFADVPEPYYSAIFLAAKKLSPAIQKATGCVRICTLFVGYEIPHCHYHLVPTNTLSDVNFTGKPQADMEELKTMQEKILSELNINHQ